MSMSSFLKNSIRGETFFGRDLFIDNPALTPILQAAFFFFFNQNLEAGPNISVKTTAFCLAAHRLLSEGQRPRGHESPPFLSPHLKTPEARTQTQKPLFLILRQKVELCYC